MIDLHTRPWSSLETLGPDSAAIWRRLFQSKRYNPADTDALSASLIKANINHCCVVGFIADRLSINYDLTTIKTHINALQPHGIQGIAIAGYDPTNIDDINTSLDSLKRDGAKGIHMCLGAIDMLPTHSKLQPVFAWCQANDMPIFIEQSTLISPKANLECDSPLAFDVVLREFPKLRVMLTGCGGLAWAREALTLLCKHDNAYANISQLGLSPWHLYQLLLDIHAYQLWPQFSFASGFPVHTPDEALKALYDVNRHAHATQLPEVPREQLRRLIENDPLNLLKS